MHTRSTDEGGSRMRAVLNATAIVGRRTHYVRTCRERYDHRHEETVLHPVALCGAGKLRRGTWGPPVRALTPAPPPSCSRCLRAHRRDGVHVMADMTAARLATMRRAVAAR